MLDSFNLLKGIEAYGGSKELYEDLKKRLFSQKIEHLAVDELLKVSKKRKYQERHYESIQT